jgi:hypothetical protein
MQVIVMQHQVRFAFIIWVQHVTGGVPDGSVIWWTQIYSTVTHL